MLLNARVERDGTTYRVKLDVASPTCTGDVHLTGKVGKGVLLTGEQCTVIARFLWRTLTLEEDWRGSCAHGASCSFTER